MGLTFKQETFLSNYLGKSKGNATDAARRAGYANPRQAGAHLLSNAVIQRAISAKLNGKALKTAEILERLTAIATGDLGEFMKIDEDGNLRDVVINPTRTRLIHTIKHNEHGPEIRLHDPLKALQLLGRFRGLWDRHLRAIKREELELLRRKLEGDAPEITLADLVAAAEERAEKRKRERESEP